MLKQYLIAAAFGTCGYFLGTAMANASACMFVNEIFGVPDEPDCTSSYYGPFNADGYGFDSYDMCRSEVEEYLEDLANWQECLGEKADEAIENFNRRARGY